ncbi:MAG: MG2 domain-containing protein [Polyangiaceae bacterium]|nr:MG2 domain-containing protein [Polyangiaceae bacterium]
MRSRRALGALASLLALASCLPGGRLPLAAPAPSRGPRPLRPELLEAAPDQGPLRLAFATPEGPEIEAPLPTFVFSRSFRRLGDPPHLPAVQATIEPPVEGSWHWIGTRTLQFSPRNGFPQATPYRITLQPGLRSLDGQTLDQPLSLEFSTPRLQLRDATLPETPTEPLALTFNQDVDPAALRDVLSIVDEDQRTIPWTFSDRKPHDAAPSRLHLLAPRRGRWPEGISLSLALRPPLRSTEGPLGLDAPVLRTLRERLPAVVEELRCSAEREQGLCEEYSSIELTLSQPLTPAQLRPLLRLDPPLPLSLQSLYGNSGDPSERFQISAPFRTEVPYKLTVRSSTGRRRGAPGIDQGAELSFRLVPPTPHFSYLLRGTILRPSWASALQLRPFGMTRATVRVAPVSPQQLREAFCARNPLLSGVRLADPRSRDFTFASAKESPTLDLAPLLPPGAGSIFLETEGEGPTGKAQQQQLLHRTDLAIASRVSAEGSLFWITDLTSATPVAQAQVEVHDCEGRSLRGTTDAQGLVPLDTTSLGKPDGRLFVVARRGEDWLSTELSAPRPPSPEALLFADRGFYRPGETIHLKGVVRDPSTAGLRPPPEGREVKLLIETRAGTTEVSRKLSSWGTFAHDMALPADLPPGRVRFLVEEQGRRIAATSAEVYHFRPQSFRVSAEVNRATLTPGEAFRCGGHANYLDGSSLRGAASDLRVKLRAGVLRLPGLEGYQVGDHVHRLGAQETTLKQLQGKLDDGGRAGVEGQVPGQGLRYPTTLECSIEVSDPGEQAQEAMATALVHPADFYVALRPAQGRPQPGSPASIAVVAASPDGTLRSEKVRVELRPMNTFDWHERPPLSSCEVQTGKQPASCSLRTPDAAHLRYHIEARSIDASGRETVTGLEGWTSAPPLPGAPRGRPPAPRPTPAVHPPPPPRFFQLSHGVRRPGEPVSVRLNPTGTPASGLFTVEREGLFLQQVFSGLDELPFTPTPTMAAEVWAQAEVLYPISPEVPYKKHERVRQEGGDYLRVEDTDRALRVQLTPSKQEASPGDQIEVDLQVTGPQGGAEQAEVTLYAVDEGVLQLSGYETPDLLRYLDLPSRHLVRSSNTRDELGWLLRPGVSRLSGEHRTRPPQVRMGATMVGDREGPRADFSPTPLYLPSLVTDAEGRAHASFKLPDSLTAYRLMAVAVGKTDHFGKAEAQIKASLRAQIRPATPRVVRAGDRFEVAAVAVNNTQGPLDVTVSLDATGFQLPPGHAPRKLRLDAGSSRRVTFPVEAPRAGQGKLTFRLDGEALRDAAEASIDILSPVTMEAAALYGKTSQIAQEELADLAQLREDLGGLELTVSSTPVTGLAPALEQLIEYPYGCTEQLTSRLVPLLALRDLARSLGVSLPAEVDPETRKAVAQILEHRHKDGTFGYWRGSAAYPWLTAYAYWGLGVAQGRGIPVEPGVFEEAAPLLAGFAARWGEGKKQAAEATFALDVLADLPGLSPELRNHAAVLARQLLEHHAGLPSFARFQLLHAGARLGLPADELAPLLKEVEASLHLDGPVARAVVPTEWYPELLDSQVRSSAMALRALQEAAPGHPMREALARGLVADRGPKGWRTTQENAWALLALDAYRRASPAAQGKARVTLGGETLLEGLLSGGAAELRARVPMERLAQHGGAPLLVEAGGGELHYEARLRYAPRSLPTTPVVAGFEVMQRCHLIPGRAGEPLGAELEAFQVGMWVSCQVEATTPTARSNVALDIPIPAGFEPIHPSTQGLPRHVTRWIHGLHDHQELRPERLTYFMDHLRPGHHRWSYAARVTTAGEFIAPPIRMEEMYNPEVYGRTGARRVTVNP